MKNKKHPGRARLNINILFEQKFMEIIYSAHLSTMEGVLNRGLSAWFINWACGFEKSKEYSQEPKTEKGVIVCGKAIYSWKGQHALAVGQGTIWPRAICGSCKTQIVAPCRHLLSLMVMTHLTPLCTGHFDSFIPLIHKLCKSMQTVHM